MQYISYNTAGRDFPDIYALALGHCVPSGVVRIYPANPSLLCYNLYMLTVAVTALKDIYNKIMVSFVYFNTVLFSV